MENEKKIRILNIVPNMRAAGIESFIMNVYRNIDKSKVQFDFLVHSEKREFYDNEIEKLGGKIYRLSFKDDKNFIKYVKDLNQFFKHHKEYKIVHGHMQSMMPLYLYFAKKNNVPVRIAHSHNSDYEKTFKGLILHILSRFSKIFSTINFACSDTAGKYLFGKSEYTVILNGIDVSKYKFDSSKRIKIREELNINDKFVIGHIGRFELQKNHKFIIDMFEKYLEKNENSILLLIGEGTLYSNIKEIVDKRNMNDKVRFLGVRSDADVLYNGMDCFILPSLYEGLPVVGVESQVSGLPVLFSNNVTREVLINDKSDFLDLSDINNWLNYLQKIDNESINANRIVNNCDNFDIRVISNKLESFYEEYYKN